VVGEPIWTLLDEEAADWLRRWCDQTGTRVKYAGWRDAGDGNTGASVFAVYAWRDGILRKCALKTIPRSRRGGESREPRRHADMLAASPEEFRRRHLVETVYEPIPLPDDRWIIFQEIAGDLEEFRPLSHLLRDPGRLTDAVSCCREVVSSVLADWNPTEQESSHPTPSAFLRGVLGGRLDQGARLVGVLRDEGLLDGSGPTDKRLGEDGRWPNPLSLLDDEITRRRTLCVRTGNAHGDLHPGNILLPADPSKFRLIDLSHAGAKRPLEFDPVHLLLTTIAYLLPELSSRQSDSLADLLLEPAHDRDSWVPGPLCNLVKTITISGNDWAGRTMTAEWREVTLLCLVACALIMAGRDIHEGRHRKWFLELAARGAETYLNRYYVRRPTTVGSQGNAGAAFAIQAEPESPTHTNVPHVHADGDATRGEMPPSEAARRPLPGTADNNDRSPTATAGEDANPGMIFLCYSDVDRPRAADLRGQLMAAGVRCWSSTHDLRPGDRWRDVIPEMMERSWHVLVLVSSASSTRVGFYHREIRDALVIAAEHPASARYLMPIRLEPCEVPRSLRDYQWVDLFEPDGLDSLLRVLRLG
jgi:hypothetical protein